jgi:hypothetical protein
LQGFSQAIIDGTLITLTQRVCGWLRSAAVGPIWPWLASWPATFAVTYCGQDHLVHVNPLLTAGSRRQDMNGSADRI